VHYNFTRLGSKYFEQLVQAIAIKVLGYGTIIFGSGPDGAREATFEGRVKYPSDTENWNGYIVVQAKCREQPKGDYRDADWLVSQLESEFKKFLAPPRSLRVPDYYIIATNVELSGVTTFKDARGVTRHGGLAKVDEHFEKWKTDLGLKDYRVWPAAQLSAYLDLFEDIRATNAAWVLPSDIIIGVLERLAPSRNFYGIVQRAMANSLRANQYTRLRDAGHSTAEPIRLADVFIDLPLQASGQYELFREETDLLPSRREKRDTVVSMLLERVTQRFDRQELERFAHATPASPFKNRIVLKGGPGQGKSTIGQFLVQILQSQLLLAPGALPLAPEVRQVAEAVAQHSISTTERLAYRFPIFLSLPTYADHLPKGGRDNRFTILEEITAVICRDAAPTQVDFENVRKWLRGYPWLCIMDGLDEVPPGEIRDNLIYEIQSFLVEVTQEEADVVVVVTTREQNYRDELDKSLWEHWTLAKLLPDEAVKYAEALTAYLLPNSTDRDRVISVLAEASRASMTQRLMISPLQVTILVALIDLKGSLPGDRWQLFNRYFHVLREREEQKGLWFSPILKTQRRVIEDLHFLAGFLLHARGEHRGGAGAFFTREEFKTLVRTRLLEEDPEGANLDYLTGCIDTIATQRLVLLSSQVTGRVAFDVRSLQEYAAAAHLTSGNDVDVRARLREVARPAYWRHVFQIAASRCFSETTFDYLREDIVAICRSLDEASDDPRDRFVLNGARLALDLLKDDVASDAPIFRRQLFSHALDLLKLGGTEIVVTITSVINPAVLQRMQEILRGVIEGGGRKHALSAWAVLWLLSAKGDEWALNYMIAHWPDMPQEAIQVVGSSSIFDEIPDKSLADRANRAIEQAGIRLTEQHLNYSWGGSDGARSRSAVYQLRYRRIFSSRASEPRHANTIYVQARDTRQFIPTFALVSVQNSAEALYENLQNHDGWKVFKGSADFLDSPSPITLANALRSLTLDLDLAQRFAEVMPWPVGSLVLNATSADDLRASSERVEKGLYGDQDAWLKAEARWSRSGVSLRDLETWEGQETWGADVGERGIPFTGRVEYRSWTVEGADLSYAVSLLDRVSGNIGSEWAFTIATSALPGAYRPLDTASGRLFLSALRNSRYFMISSVFNQLASLLDLEDLATIEVLGELGRQCRFQPHHDWRVGKYENTRILTALQRNDGLLPIALSASGIGAVDWSPELFREKPNDTPTMRLCRRLLGILRGPPEERLFDHFIEALSHLSTWQIPALFSQLPALSENTELMRRVATNLIGTSVPEEYNRIVMRSLDGRRSNLDSLARWNELKLRMPYFALQLPAKETNGDSLTPSSSLPSPGAP
jgi:hypothetical protein